MSNERGSHRKTKSLIGGAGIAFASEHLESVNSKGKKNRKPASGLLGPARKWAILLSLLMAQASGQTWGQDSGLGNQQDSKVESLPQKDQQSISVSPETQRVRLVELEMKQLVAAMNRGDDSKILLEKQSLILESIDRLIQSQNESQGAENSSAGSSRRETPENPSTDENQSSEAQSQEDGAGEVGSSEGSSRNDRQPRFDLVQKAWGHLPEEVRERLQAGSTERFLPRYERMIESFYLRLSERNRSSF